MSALEPDAPAAHIFPAPQDAIRAWMARRIGGGSSRAAHGSVRGKGAQLGDIVKVGRLLTDLGHLHNGVLTPSGVELAKWAQGLRKRCDDRGFKSIVERLVEHMRSMRIVAPPTRLPAMRREKSHDEDGEERTATICVESP